MAKKEDGKVVLKIDLNEQAKQILEKAQAEAKSMHAATKQYVTGALDELERTINEALTRVRQDRNEF